MIFLIIEKILIALGSLITLGMILYAPLGAYKHFIKQEPIDDFTVLGLLLWVYFGIASCHEMEMRNCENIEEIEVTCCVDYEYGRSGQQCIEDGICIKKICVD